MLQIFFSEVGLFTLLRLALQRNIRRRLVGWSVTSKESQAFNGSLVSRADPLRALVLGTQYLLALCLCRQLIVLYAQNGQLKDAKTEVPYAVDVEQVLQVQQVHADVVLACAQVGPVYLRLGFVYRPLRYFAEAKASTVREYARATRRKLVEEGTFSDGPRVLVLHELDGFQIAAEKVELRKLFFLAGGQLVQVQVVDAERV